MALVKRPANALERVHQDLGNQTIPTKDLTINARNIRDTFRSLSELDAYLAEIGFPENVFDRDQSPLDWLEEANSEDPKKHAALTKIVALALSIKDQGQMQPIGVIRQQDRSLRVVFGSTRAMACHLLKKKVDIKLLKRSDELQELKQHLFENIKRDDLSFSETATGYLRLLEALVAAGEIESISRKPIMKHLSMSRAWASKWNTILNEMLTNSDYAALVSNDEFTGLKTAYSYLRPIQPEPSQFDVNVETGSAFADLDEPQEPADSDKAVVIENEVSFAASSTIDTSRQLRPPLFSGKPNTDSLPLIYKIMNHALQSELQQMTTTNHPDLNSFKSTAVLLMPISNLADANKAADLLRTTLD